MRSVIVIALGLVLFASACSVGNVALDDDPDPVAVALAGHLQRYGPVSSLLDGVPAMTGVGAACTADRFLDAVDRERIVELSADTPEGVQQLLDQPFPLPDDIRVAFNRAVLECADPERLESVTEQVAEAMLIQGFSFDDESLHCITQAGGVAVPMATLWVPPSPGELSFDLAADRSDELTAIQRQWATAIVTGLDSCVGLGQLVVRDLGNVGITLSASTVACMEAEGTGVSIVEGWQAGQTLPQMSDAVIDRMLLCLSEAEVAILLN